MKKINTIALVAPCGNIKNLDELNEKIEILKKNFKIKKYYNENSSNGYLSDYDKNRIKYLEEAFLDDENDLILCIRGGFGALRIVDKVNYNLIKTKEKFFLGSSDASILLAALNKKTNTKCFHGLMLTNGFLDNLEKNIEIIEKRLFKINLTSIREGKLKGKLWGGNLSSIVSMFSSENYLPDEDIVLFLEDLNEPLYKIDKMFYEIYRNKQLRQKIKGLIFGDFYFEKNKILPLLKEYADLFNTPTYLTEDITHKKNNITIPYGIDIDLN